MSDALKARALRLLSGREHSRAELARKLGTQADPDSIEALLDRLEALDLLSDARFADSYVRSRQARLGDRRLRQELKQKGVAEHLIDAALHGSTEGEDLERARQVWHKKFGTAPADAREWARQARFLQGRGFAADVIHKLLKDCDDEPA
ncbi:recombination regulator RecX [Nitrogeniibacter mangrovi]|uniref:Regulatory protein RecX n=1 Tax=Nitrogeniibacter mangrovi TaxID=2016596 RepID=A0A6C1AYU0_9RHOO|nr:recombination regulator RecX [Nitrogeniibacter mangrovi]QID16507.1 recombination regulator RecX [Nitrogeniibacter mangrovi]